VLVAEREEVLIIVLHLVELVDLVVVEQVVHQLLAQQVVLLIQVLVL
tara:strand:+ start:205 stop:345 length:141 start_codon:yes stop_codon:yes gene_type:complete